MVTHTNTHTREQSPIQFTIHGRLGAEEEEKTRRDRFWETLANTDQLFYGLVQQAHQPVLSVTSQTGFYNLQTYFLTYLYPHIWSLQSLLYILVKTTGKCCWTVTSHRLPKIVPVRNRWLWGRQPDGDIVSMSNDGLTNQEKLIVQLV